MINAYKNIAGVLTKKEKAKIILFAGANILVSLLDLFCIIFLLFVLNLYVGKAVPSFRNDILRKVFSDRRSLAPACLLLLAFCAKNFFANLIYKRLVTFVNGIAIRISENGLREYLYGDYKNYSEKDSAEFVRKIIYQPTEFTQYVLLPFQLILSEGFMIMLSFTALLIFNSQLFLIIACTLLSPVMLLLYISRRRLASIRRNIGPSAEESLRNLRESLSGYIESNIFGRNEFFIGRHTTIQTRLGKYISRMQSLQDLPPRYFEVFSICGLFILIVLMKYLSLNNDKYFLIVGAFTAAAYKVIPGISKIINLLNQSKAYAYTVAELKESCNKRPVKEMAESIPIRSISLKDATFSFGSGKVIEALNIEIDTGSLIGIFADSGKGKTTLLNLLTGFLQLKGGELHIGGHAANAENYRSFWKNMTYVKQEPFILHASILDNIVFGEEEVNKYKLEEVIEATGVGHFVKNYPEGINKILLENGKNISGGQRQRIVLARALYKDADMLLLDEPFSELDEKAQTSILKYLRHLAIKGKIILLISHNENCKAYCDRIIDLNDHHRGEAIA